MCRILGYFGDYEVAQNTIENAANRQIHGGPDHQSYRIGNGWALANNRLAVQGLDGGNQPFHSNKISAVFNGEIYNHQNLKNHLSKKGYSVTDRSDGAVILPLYELYGEAFVEKLDGMFAIALIDERHEPKIILANDNCAMKSVYYYFDQNKNTLFFASELSALFEFPMPKTIRTEAVNEYLISRALWHNDTFFEGVQSLAPSSLLIKTRNKEILKKTYQSEMFENYDDTNFIDTAFHFKKMLENEVDQMLRTDVPVCLVTSGGLDSSLITALAAQSNSNLTCFNIAYQGTWSSDERHYAKEVAKHFGLQYHQVLIRENEFPAILDKTIEHLGQPNSAPHSLSTYALFQAIHQAGFKVALTGEGADEFFGGYDRFRKASFSQNEQWLQNYFDIMCATTQEARNSLYSAEYQISLKSHADILENAIQCLQQQIKDNKSRTKALLEFDQLERFPSYILRRVDHLSMAHAVEVRIPFCQPKITSFSKSLPESFLLNQNSVKKIVYKAAKDLLPTSILKRPKQPFTLPITEMLNPKHILFEILTDTLSSHAFLNRGFFEPSRIQDLIQQQIKQPSNKTADTLWSIMILELWLQKHNYNLQLGS